MAIFDGSFFFGPNFNLFQVSGSSGGGSTQDSTETLNSGGGSTQDSTETLNSGGGSTQDSTETLNSGGGSTQDSTETNSGGDGVINTGDGVDIIGFSVEPDLETLDDTPIPVEPDGGIGDGAGPIGPIPVEPDGGIGDGGVIIELPVEAGREIYEENEDGILVPVEPDGGIGDGAGPLEPIPVDADGGIGDGAGPIGLDNPIPVEHDGGIGDGAGPLGPIPVDADGGIGDGAPSLFSFFNLTNTSEGGTQGTDLFIASGKAETFSFAENQGSDFVVGFDIQEDTLDISQTATDFTDIASLQAASTEVVDAFTGTIYGLNIDLGDGETGFLNGISQNDLGTMDIVF